MKSCMFLIAVSVCAQMHSDYPPDVNFVPNSNKPLAQISGSKFQIQSNGHYRVIDTQNDSVKAYGVWGTDEGASVLLPDGTLLPFFGDTMSAYQHANGNYVYEGGGMDTLAYIPPTDWSKCKWIENIEAQVSAGVVSPAYPFDGCNYARWYINPNPAPYTPKRRGLSIKGLLADESIGGFLTPTAAWRIDKRIYLLYSVINQEDFLHIRSIVVKSDQDYDQISNTNPITFTRLYALSNTPELPTFKATVTQGETTVKRESGEHFSGTWIGNNQQIELSGTMYGVTAVKNPHTLTIDRPARLTETNALSHFVSDQNVSTAKFAFGAATVLTLQERIANGWEDKLPQALKGADKVVFLHGSTFVYRRSNVYLAVNRANQLDSSASSWYYLTSMDANGTPYWHQGAQVHAIPLMTTWTHKGASDGAPCVGEHDVKWYPPLKRFLMTYGAAECGGLWYRTSKTPWGPWSGETRFFNNSGGWHAKLINTKYDDNLITNNVTGARLYQSNGTSVINFSTSGNIYGPYLTGQYTDHGDGTLSIYHLFSAFDPYQVWMAEFIVRIPNVP